MLPGRRSSATTGFDNRQPRSTRWRKHHHENQSRLNGWSCLAGDTSTWTWRPCTCWRHRPVRNFGLRLQIGRPFMRETSGMPTELPITAAILAAETGLPEAKAISLIDDMRRAGLTACHARTHLVFRSDVAEFLRERTRSRNNERASPEAKSLEDAMSVCPSRRSCKQGQSLSRLTSPAGALLPEYPCQTLPGDSRLGILSPSLIHPECAISGPGPLSGQDH